MEEDIVKVIYSLRFIGISKSCIDKFRENFPDIEIEIGKYFKDKSKLILIFQLDENINFSKIKYFAENSFYETLDMFVSIDSETDNYIVEVPNYVLEAIREFPLKANISFMYTSIE